MAARKNARSASAKKASRGAAKKSSAKKGGAAKKASARGAPEGASEVPVTRATGGDTATGTAIREAERDDLPQGKDRGSKNPIEGGDQIKPDLITPPGKPTGLQSEPALYTSNGEVDVTQLPTPTGPVGPAAAEGVNSLDDYIQRRDKRIEELKTAEDRRADLRRKAIDERTVNSLSKTDLRAIAQQRGYEDFPEDRGTRATREAFLRSQEKDTFLKKE